VSRRFWIIAFVIYAIANTAVAVSINVVFRPWLEAHLGQPKDSTP
jgi:hypothetical protein